MRALWAVATNRLFNELSFLKRDKPKSTSLDVPTAT